MIQVVEFRVLSCFFGQDSCRFAEICRRVGFPTDLGGYYIRRLVKSGSLTRSDRGIYTITYKGKQQLAGSYGREPIVIRPRLCAMIVAEQDGKFVALQRTRQPFIGAIEWPAGAIMHGENVSVAAKRILLERLGVSGTPSFVGMFRRIDMYNNAVFDDKLFALHTYKLPAAAMPQKEGFVGKTLLCSPDELLKLETPSKSLVDIFTFITSGASEFIERTYQLQLEDLFLD